MNWWMTPFGHWLITFVISMVPVVELRGAIPFGVSMGMEPWLAIVTAIVGNLIPVPFIIIFIRRIFAVMRRWSRRFNRLITRLESVADRKAEKVRQYEMLGLFLLVAIPLPGTGAWTGSLVAAMMNMRLKRAFPTIAAGVAAAGIVVAFVTYGAGAILFG